MFLWFCVTSVLGIAVIFRSPFLDYRLLALGALLPLVETMLGFQWLFHTLFFGVLVLSSIMLLGRGNRKIQQKLLPLPIGLLTHLVLDGTWTETEIFWWPVTGRDLLGTEVSRLEFSFLPTGMILEILGVIITLWAWRKFELNKQVNLKAFLKNGHLLALEGN
ncbi:MAG: hypothetical protein QGI12_05305 [Acidimicrobiales bacterium]|jgi:hypothetical protein|nr:hypothetical protein [Acidimicrobiales bacterium]